MPALLWLLLSGCLYNAVGRWEILAWHSAWGVAFTTYQTSFGGPWAPWTKV